MISSACPVLCKVHRRIAQLRPPARPYLIDALEASYHEELPVQLRILPQKGILAEMLQLEYLRTAFRRGEEDYNKQGEAALGKYVKERYNSDFFFVNRFPYAIKPLYSHLYVNTFVLHGGIEQYKTAGKNTGTS